MVGCYRDLELRLKIWRSSSKLLLEGVVCGDYLEFGF